VFNLAEYLKANPDMSVVLQGYADKGTGTAEYNQSLSKRRAQAVYDALTKKYGINGNRLSIDAEGSSVQPYDTNDWNRIVIFAPQE
ncbi:MAG: OmpA family protein, partial [Muribaculaceae bacterium]|nr:OmpA family protein [Muribaculaceae bacterium]